MRENFCYVFFFKFILNISVLPPRVGIQSRDFNLIQQDWSTARMSVIKSINIKLNSLSLKYLLELFS
jgi:hypothetical protein